MINDWIKPGDFRSRWGSSLQTFPPAYFANISLPANTVIFLTEQGLPSFLSFTWERNSTISTVATAFALKSPFDNYECDPTQYWMIGSNGYGDPVVLDVAGKVWGLNCDDRFSPYLLASSIPQLAAIFLVFRRYGELILEKSGISHNNANQWLYDELERLDPSAAEGEYWQEQIERSPEEIASYRQVVREVHSAHEDIDAAIEKLDSLPPDVL